MMDESNLKPCPFCGGEASMIQKSWDLFITGVRIECDECGASTSWTSGAILRDVRKRAVEAWNKRVEEDK